MSEIRDFSNDNIRCICSLEGNLGEGSYGTVRLGRHDVIGNVACKCSPMQGRKDQFEKKVRQEIGMLQKVNHENVVRVYGWAMGDRAIAIIMEYLPAGNLKAVLLDDEVELSALVLLRFSAEIANGLACIHNLFRDKRIIHGDIKPENIIMTGDLHCKIADFGGARLTCYTGGSTNTKRHDFQFTHLYAAPEMLLNIMAKLTPKYDTFSFGMTMHMMLTREMPVQLDLQMDLYMEGVKIGKRPDLQNIDELKCKLRREGKHGDAEIIQVLEDEMKRCWQQDPNDRPTMLEVKDLLYEMLANNNVAKLLRDVSVARDSMDVTEPSFNTSECVPLQCFLSPGFCTVSARSSGSQYPVTTVDQFPSVETTRNFAPMAASNLRQQVTSSSSENGPFNMEIQPVSNGGNASNSGAISRRVSNSGAISRSPSNNGAISRGASSSGAISMGANNSGAFRGAISSTNSNQSSTAPVSVMEAKQNIKISMVKIKHHLAVKEATGYLDDEALEILNEVDEEISPRLSCEFRQQIADKLASEGGAHLLLQLLKVLTDNCKTYPGTGCDLTMFEKARNLCWSASNASMKFCMQCGKSGLLNLLSNDLKKLQTTFQQNLQTHGVFVLQAMNIIYNCAWLRPTREYVKALGIKNLITWYSKNTHNLKIRGIETLAATSIAVMVCILEGESPNSMLADSQVIGHIIENMYDSLANDDHSWNGFPVWALVDGLVKLARNRVNSVVILRHGDTLRALVSLLNQGSDIEKTASVDLIRTLAFVRNNRSELKSESRITPCLERIQNEATNENLKRMAGSALSALVAVA